MKTSILANLNGTTHVRLGRIVHSCTCERAYRQEYIQIFLHTKTCPLMSPLQIDWYEIDSHNYSSPPSRTSYTPSSLHSCHLRMQCDAQTQNGHPVTLHTIPKHTLEGMQPLIPPQTNIDFLPSHWYTINISFDNHLKMLVWQHPTTYTPWHTIPPCIFLMYVFPRLNKQSNCRYPSFAPTFVNGARITDCMCNDNGGSFASKYEPQELYGYQYKKLHNCYIKKELKIWKKVANTCMPLPPWQQVTPFVQQAYADMSCPQISMHRMMRSDGKMDRQLLN